MYSTMKEFFGEELSFDKNEYLSKMISTDVAKNMKKMIDDVFDHLTIGGMVDVENRFVQPTLLLNPPLDSDIMKYEIFGPILPIIEYSDINEPINWMLSHPKGLAAYYFGTKKSTFNRLNKETSTGALIQNDCSFQPMEHNLPFGGVGYSGYGNGHGKGGFDQMSHLKGIYSKYGYDGYPLDARYPPYTPHKTMIMKIVFALHNFTYP